MCINCFEPIFKGDFCKEHYKAYQQNRKKWYYKHKESILNKRKELIKLSKELGNCTKCHLPKPTDKYVICSRCREYQRNWERRNDRNTTTKN